MRLVDADALEPDAEYDDGEYWAYSRTQIEKAPTIEPERKRGKWIYGEHDCQDGWFCSECNGFIPWDYEYYGLDNIDFIKDFKTCPHCDAVMVSYTGKEEGEQDE